ncbi:MAG: hypothetical protein AAFN81_20345 [Bacteroidota bacterium]
MKHLMLLLLLLVGLNFSANAQSSTNQDKVHLKDGTTHTGIIIEQKPGSHLKLLRLPEQDTLQFYYSDVDKITKEMSQIETSEDQLKTEKPTLAEQEKLLTQIHAYLGGGDYSLAGFGLTLSKPVHNQWLVGAGVHYIAQLNTRPFIRQQDIALTADVKWRYGQSANKRRMGYLSLAVGYYFQLNKDFYYDPINGDATTRNTFYLNPSIGFRWDVFKWAGFMVDFGYQYTTATYFSQSNDERLFNRNFNNIAIRGTLIF